MPETFPRYLVVTAYHKEEPRLLNRVMTSVQGQTVPADHLFIADGHPQDWIDGKADELATVRHIVLDRSHGDVGNTVRAIGGMLAIAEGYDGVCFCDADNWLEPDHVEACIAAAAKSPRPCDYVIAQRTLRRADGSAMPIPEELGHVDANCFFFLPGSYSVLPFWGLMPKAYAVIGDRLMARLLITRGYVAAGTDHPTVNYTTRYLAHYRALGEEPPADAKVVDMEAVLGWSEGLSPREMEMDARMTGGLVLRRPPLS